MLKPQRRQRCDTCKRKAQRANRKPDARQRSTPYGKKSATCTGCSKPVWRGRGSLEAPCCRDCRRAGRLRVWWFCEHCGDYFVQREPSSRFCSRTCAISAVTLYADPRQASRISARKRRAVIAATWDGVTDEQIWERDHWTCQLGNRCLFPAAKLDWCLLGKGLRVSSREHPLYPTIDHIVPLRRGGTDTSANKRAAHLACNCSRGTRMTSEEESLAVLMPELAPLGVLRRKSNERLN